VRGVSAFLTALICLAVLPAGAAAGASGRVLRVGPARQFKTVRAACAACRDGDTVEIDAGVYKGDVCKWTRSDITVRGVGGMAHLDADGKHEGGKGTFVVHGRNFTAENLEFSGSKVPDENGSGIRAHGRGLTVRNCYFHDNENGILGGGGSESDVLIEYCEFARNGHGDGYSHNMYISHVRSLTVRFTYSHHANIGHNLKSRALRNVITYNRIMDEADGRSSYSIDLPNGGFSVVVGNLIQQGPRTDNSAIFAYAAEGAKNPDSRLYVVANTFVNDRSRGDFLRVRSCTGGLVANNLFLGRGGVRAGKAEVKNNLVSADSEIVVDRAGYDYRLTAAAVGAIDKAIDAGGAGELLLGPVAHYVHKARGEERAAVGAADIGAYEFGCSAERKYAPGLIALVSPRAEPKPEPEPKPDPKPETAARPKPPPPPEPEPFEWTPEAVCQGWYSMARNYKNAGIVKEARRCLKNIINEYPDSKWAAKARTMLKQLGPAAPGT
jgi:hypothetical protein